jgi:hypothetical protein
LTNAERQKEIIMKKQIIKGFTMLMLIIALAFVTAVVSANGQSQRATANIPFEFIVGDKSLPAGNYALGALNSSSDVLKVSSADAKEAAMRLTMPLDGKSKSAKLVFHRYGERNFLAEIWTGPDGDGRSVVKGHKERAIEKEMSRIASLGGSTKPAYETVEVALAVR